MASVAHDAHLPALEHHGREEVGRELQATLVELIDLSLIGKQLHWNIFGRPFKPLHEHLDERLERPSEDRSEEHTSELQSLRHLVCRLLLEKKKPTKLDNRKR